MPLHTPIMLLSCHSILVQDRKLTCLYPIHARVADGQPAGDCFAGPATRDSTNVALSLNAPLTTFTVTFVEAVLAKRKHRMPAGCGGTGAGCGNRAILSRQHAPEGDTENQTKQIRDAGWPSKRHLNWRWSSPTLLLIETPNDSYSGCVHNLLHC